MPIFEFKCLDCDKYMEILVMNKQEEMEMACLVILTLSI